MILLSRVLLLLSLLLLAPAGAVRAAPGPCVVTLPLPVQVALHTTEGTVVLELLPSIAPCTVNNFVDYVTSGAYDGTIVHRNVPGFVIQGGGYTEQAGAYASIGRGPIVVNEPGESNLLGTIAMARGAEVDSATSEWFINLADNIPLDTTNEGFTVFGNVISGMDTAVAIEGKDVLDMRFASSSPFGEVFRNLPLSDPVIFGSYGCFDPDPSVLRALVLRDGNGQAFLATDPQTGGPYYLSTACDGSGASGPPIAPCTIAVELAYYHPGVGGWLLDTETMVCDAVAESEVSLAARRTDLDPQIPPRLVEVTSAILLPEPTFGALLAAGGTALAALYRLRRRAR